MSPNAIKIVEYQTQWPAEFDRIATTLLDALGADALRIDHIGSTAVVGLCAKDIIDIQVTVGQLDDGIAQKLVDARFSLHTDLWRHDHVPPGFDASERDWIKLFFMQKPDQRRCNIHVRQLGSANQRYALLVRDFLRHDSHAAQAYGRLKSRLATSLADPDAYPDVKDPAVDLIHLAAERWALQSGWGGFVPVVPL